MPTKPRANFAFTHTGRVMRGIRQAVRHGEESPETLARIERALEALAVREFSRWWEATITNMRTPQL